MPKIIFFIQLGSYPKDWLFKIETKRKKKKQNAMTWEKETSRITDNRDEQRTSKWLNMVKWTSSNRFSSPILFSGKSDETFVVCPFYFVIILSANSEVHWKRIKKQHWIENSNLVNCECVCATHTKSNRWTIEMIEENKINSPAIKTTTLFCVINCKCWIFSSNSISAGVGSS